MMAKFSEVEDAKKAIKFELEAESTQKGLNMAKTETKLAELKDAKP